MRSCLFRIQARLSEKDSIPFKCLKMNEKGFGLLVLTYQQPESFSYESSFLSYYQSLRADNVYHLVNIFLAQFVS